MKEEYINRLYYLAKLKNYKGTRDEFVEKLQTDDSYFNYALYMARNDKVKYKGTDEEFSIAIGRTKPQSTQSETAATEETAKVEKPVVKEEVKIVAEEPVIEEPIIEEKPAIQVKEVEAPKEEVVKKEMPIGENLVPITKKTEVKAVETPSDKLVVKSEKKEEVKEQPKPEEKPQMEVKDVTKKESNKLKIKRKSKLEPIDVKLITKIGSDNKEEKIELIDVKPIEPSKKYKPYGEKGPDVYYSEEYDQYIINEGDKKILAEKGSDKYNELDSKIGDSAKATIEGIGKCDPDTSSDACSKNGGFLSNFLSLNNDNYESGFRTTTEGILINKLNEDKEDFDETGESRYVRFTTMNLEDQNEKDPEIQEIIKRRYEFNKKAGQIWYANDELPKDKRFVIYKPYGNDDTLIYDKESEVILKQVGKAPYVSPRDLSGENDVRQTYKKIQQENPNEGLNVWYGYHKDRPEYKELKSLIDGMDYKKEKGSKNTFVPLTTTPDLTPEWLKNKNTSEQPQVEVKDVTEKKSETPKYRAYSFKGSKPDELPMNVDTKDIISIPDELKYKKQPEIEKKEGLYTYDDMKFDLENNPPAFLINTGELNIDNNIKYEKLSPSEILEKDIFKGKNIKLERNVDLNFPDPPGVVLKKEKIGGKEVYPSYDKKNDKWYFYQEGSDKNNWTEVKSGTIKTMLNSKYKTDKHNTEIDKKSLYVKPKQDDPSNKSEIQRRKSALIYNVYLPYMIQNYDNLTEEQKNKFHKQLFENPDVRTFASNPVDPEYPYSDMWNKVHEIYENEWRKANKGFNEK